VVTRAAVAEVVLMIWEDPDKVVQVWVQNVDQEWEAKTRVLAVAKAEAWVTRVEWEIKAAALLLLIWIQMKAVWIVEILAVAGA
jgi:hypothetical protein